MDHAPDVSFFHQNCRAPFPLAVYFFRKRNFEVTGPPSRVSYFDIYGRQVRNAFWRFLWSLRFVYIGHALLHFFSASDVDTTRPQKFAKYRIVANLFPALDAERFGDATTQYRYLPSSR